MGSIDGHGHAHGNMTLPNNAINPDGRNLRAFVAFVSAAGYGGRWATRVVFAGGVHMIKLWSFISLLLLCGVAGCGGGGMVKSGKQIAPEPTKATIVFMRSSFVGSAISAAVYDVSGDQSQFIGIIDNGTKIAYDVNVGEHTFMVVSEAADFMKANFQSGKTYYALVTPRVGVWRARFSFRPLRQSDLAGSDFADWNSDTELVEPGPDAQRWAVNNTTSVEAKRSSYWGEWSSKSPEQQRSQTLNAEDGR
ncbi:MAG: hypothetical protein L0Y43_02025 [Methylococcaceae bacterium]|nr:hypothetical protein [Methylococcaceae bacterium]